jgi:hypothetical protein
MEFWKGSPNVDIHMNKFDRNRIEMREINTKTARDVIVKNHYSHAWPVAKLCLGFYIDGKLNGVIVYGHSATSKMENSLPSPNYWELQRLYSFDWAGKNVESFMIGASIRHIKKNYTEIDCLISFADPEQGHFGTIYQATNWLYCGMSQPDEWYIVGDEKIHPRTMVARYGTRGKDKLKEMGVSFTKKLLHSKHRYIYLLPNNKRHKKELIKSLEKKYEILPYPKKDLDN